MKSVVLANRMVQILEMGELESSVVMKFLDMQFPSELVKLYTLKLIEPSYTPISQFKIFYQELKSWDTAFWFLKLPSFVRVLIPMFSKINRIEMWGIPDNILFELYWRYFDPIVEEIIVCEMNRQRFLLRWN